MARQSIPKEHKAVQVCITLNPDIIARLDACRKPWQTRSAQIREIIESYITKIQAN